VILVTGATGNVGRPLIDALLARGALVRALTRHPAAAALPPEVDVVGGDLSIAASLEPALAGVDTVFLLWRQDTADHPRAAISVFARRARRIVYVSSLSVRDDLVRQTHPMTAIHADIEDAIRASGLGWTFLRAGTFATNALAWADEIRATRTIRLPYPDAGRSPIDPADVARVAAAVLTDDAHVGGTYVLSGPEMLTEADKVRILGEATGLPVRCVPIAPEAARAAMLDDGVPEELVAAALDYWRHLVTDPEPVTDHVERISGTRAVSFRAWADLHADAFR
jgi:uncharacterized protein YbjT (DUF2867 family)